MISSSMYGQVMASVKDTLRDESGVLEKEFIEFQLEKQRFQFFWNWEIVL